MLETTTSPDTARSTARQGLKVTAKRALAGHVDVHPGASAQYTSRPASSAEEQNCDLPCRIIRRPAMQGTTEHHDWSSWSNLGSKTMQCRGRGLVQYRPDAIL